MVHVSVLVREQLERERTACECKIRVPSAVSAHVSGLVHVLRAAWLAHAAVRCACARERSEASAMLSTCSS